MTEKKSATPHSFADEMELLGAEATERQLREQAYRFREKAIAAGKEVSGLRDQLKEAKAEADELVVELGQYRRAWDSRPDWLTEVRPKGPHQGTLVAMLSDVHTAEVVEPAEMAFTNCYNLEICEHRIERYFTRTIILARDFLAGVSYDGIVLVLDGDLLNGDIHEDARETNEVSTLRASELLVPWLAKGIEMWAEEYHRVHVVSAPGNHPRDSAKPRYKRRSEHNGDTHVANLLAGILSSDDITFDIPEAPDVDFEVYGSRFSAEHGNDFNFNMQAEIGAIGPVKRGNLRKTKQRQEEGTPFRYGLYGHFHQYIPAHQQGFVMNGSLVGYNEFARGHKFAPEPPQQALMVVTPEHGITINAAVLCGKRSEEGW